MDRRPRPTLICGLPGSGKSTLAREIGAATGAAVLTPDEWMSDLGVDLWDEGFRARLERRLWALAQDLLRRRVSVVLESGFWERTDRDEKRLGARELGADVELRVLRTPREELWRRLVARGTPVGVTREHLLEWEAAIEWSDAAEQDLFDPA